jgi:hypothetical protein
MVASAPHAEKQTMTGVKTARNAQGVASCVSKKVPTRSLTGKVALYGLKPFRKKVCHGKRLSHTQKG